MCSLLSRKGPHEVYRDVRKMGCRQHKVALWGNCVAGDLGELVGLPSPFSGVATFCTPDDTKGLCDQLRSSFGTWVGQIMDELEHMKT